MLKQVAVKHFIKTAVFIKMNTVQTAQTCALMAIELLLRITNP